MHCSWQTASKIHTNNSIKNFQNWLYASAIAWKERFTKRFKWKQKRKKNQIENWNKRKALERSESKSRRAKKEAEMFSGNRCKPLCKWSVFIIYDGWHGITVNIVYIHVYIFQYGYIRARTLVCTGFSGTFSLSLSVFSVFVRRFSIRHACAATRKANIKRKPMIAAHKPERMWERQREQNGDTPREREQEQEQEQEYWRFAPSTIHEFLVNW